MTDAQIIDGLNRRDERALQAIREQYGTICYNMAFRIVGNREDAEECVSDMLMAVWDSIPPTLPVSLQAYLLTLVRRAAVDRFRHEHRLKRGGTEFHLALDELAEIIPSGEAIEDTMERRELLRVLTDFLQSLKPKPRRLFWQRYFLSLPVQTIAEENHMRESAVKMSLLRTRNKLQDYLRKEGLL